MQTKLRFLAIDKEAGRSVSVTKTIPGYTGITRDTAVFFGELQDVYLPIGCVAGPIHFDADDCTWMIELDPLEDFDPGNLLNASDAFYAMLRERGFEVSIRDSKD